MIPGLLHLMRPRQWVENLHVAGWVLALDIPLTVELGTVLDRIDEPTVVAGGGVHLAKVGLLRPHLVTLRCPRLDERRALRAELDPYVVFTSGLSRRLQSC